MSFVYALRWYGLIPEHVAHITSATFSRGRKKRYDTPVGSFFYQDVPVRAYPLGVGFVGDRHRRFLMASPEKALCDELYRISGIRSISGIKELLFQNLRLEAVRRVLTSGAHNVSRAMANLYSGLLKLYDEKMKGDPMVEYQLTPEAVQELGERFADAILASLPIEKRLEGLKPEEQMIGLKPEERLIGLKPEEVLDSLPAEDIAAYLKKSGGWDG